MTRRKRQVDRGFRSCELPDGRWLGWTEIRGTGAPRLSLGLVDGKRIDDTELLELIGLARTARRPTSRPRAG